MTEKVLFEKDFSEYCEVTASIEDGKGKLSVEIPLELIAEKTIDPLIDKLKGVFELPGDLDDAVLESARAAIREAMGLSAQAPATVASSNASISGTPEKA